MIEDKEELGKWCFIEKGGINFIVWYTRMLLQLGTYIIWEVKITGFPGGALIKNPPANAGDARDIGSIPGSGRSRGEENGNPFQSSCLEIPTDRGPWWATVRRVTKKPDVTEQLSIRAQSQVWGGSLERGVPACNTWSCSQTNTDVEGLTFVNLERTVASPPKEVSQKMVRDPGRLKNSQGSQEWESFNESSHP